MKTDTRNTMEQTLFEAMERFEKIQYARCISSSEVALFYCLLHIWNRSMRPEVIGMWMSQAHQYGGLSHKALTNARKHLIEKGVIHYQKAGNRSEPRYSLLALFNLPTPFPDGKQQVNQQV